MKQVMPSFTLEWRLLDPVADLEALRLYLDTVEEQLAFLQDQWQGGWVNRCVNVSGGILPLLG